MAYEWVVYVLLSRVHPWYTLTLCGARPLWYDLIFLHLISPNQTLENCGCTFLNCLLSQGGCVAFGL